MLEALSVPDFIQKGYLQLYISLLNHLLVAVAKTRLNFLWLSFVTVCGTYTTILSQLSR